MKVHSLCAAVIIALSSSTLSFANDITQKGGASRLADNQIETLKQALEQQNVKNVILLIGDGMGDSEISIARNYAKGANGKFQGLDNLPFSGQYTPYALDPKTKLPNYVADSASSATAWASGIKTFNGALGVDVNGKAFPTLLEMAKLSGLATGNVSTAEIQDATPAAQYSHVQKRKCYGPDITSTLCPESALENNGLGSITEQLLNTRPDITLGGGLRSFNELAKAGDYKDRTLLEQAAERGYIIVKNADELANISSADQNKPVLGLFSEGTMPIRWKGPTATNGGASEPAVKCQINTERTESIPTLATMTEKAIEVLSKNDNGFFLQVEGASIDKQDHLANPCGQIGETVDLDEAVQVALNFAQKDGTTLVIVTADHAHASQIVPAGASTPGLTQTLLTKDGAPMTISYGTSVQNMQELWPDMQFKESEKSMQNHTGAQLRIAAYGPQAANVTGLLDQTDLFFIIQNALKLQSPQ